MDAHEIRLTSSQLDRLLDHASNNTPKEAVALLFGKVENEVVFVSQVETVENILQNQCRFKVDPHTQYQLYIEADERNEEMVGIFHTHPKEISPSEIDIRNMMLNPVVWMIATRCASGWMTNAFVLSGTGPKKIRIRIDE